MKMSAIIILNNLNAIKHYYIDNNVTTTPQTLVQDVNNPLKDILYSVSDNQIYDKVVPSAKPYASFRIGANQINIQDKNAQRSKR